MGNEQDEYHSAIRRLKKRWDYEDAERHSVERRTQEKDYLTRLDEVLRALGASVEIDLYMDAPWRAKAVSHRESEISPARPTTLSCSHNSRSQHLVP